VTITEALSSGRVLVAGAGVAGAGVARMLAPLGCTVTLADDNTDRGRELAAQTGAVAVTVSDAQDALGEVDLLITSPGWRPDSPLLLAAAHRGVPVIGDIDAAWLADRAGLFG